jgi:4-amino-4-deoxy-L-arabinose transferase-like glycosyltransferase
VNVAKTRSVTPTRNDKLVLVAILALAAVLRLVGLPQRGQWDDDQGTELLAMLLWVRDGQVPLVGPLSSDLTVHHGVAFYWILAPAAFLSDAHPLAAVTTLALIGIAGVAAAWWLGATVGGPLAGHITALLMAVSPSAINASTFVWNANIVAPAAALASAAAWHAWRTRRARWWSLSAVGGLLMLHGHLLAAIAVPSFMALLIADVLRRPRSDRLRMLAPILSALAIIAAGYLPLLVYDMHHGFSQIRAISRYLVNGGELGGRSVLARLRTIFWRVLAWPVSGVAESAPLKGIPAASVTAAALATAATTVRGITRQFGRWAAATTVWAVIALSVISPSLVTQFPGLPNDQYHAWLDPILFATVGVVGVRLWTMKSTLLARIVAVAAVGTCVALSLAAMPPLSSPDGGWPRAARTAERIRSITTDRPTAITGVVKSAAAVEFALRRQHTPIDPPSTAEFLVVICDPLFYGAVVTPCGGPAEEARARQVGFPTARVVDRFADSPRRVISIFANR